MDGAHNSPPSAPSSPAPDQPKQQQLSSPSPVLSSIITTDAAPSRRSLLSYSTHLPTPARVVRAVRGRAGSPITPVESSPDREDDVTTPDLAKTQVGAHRGRSQIRSRSTSRTPKRAASVDVARPYALGRSIFAVISATSRAKFNRLVAGDDDDTDIEAPELDEDENFDDDQSSGDEHVSAAATGKSMPLASSFLLNNHVMENDEDSESLRKSRYVFTSPLEPIKSVGSLVSTTTIRPAGHEPEDTASAKDDAGEQDSVDASKSSLLADKLMKVFGFLNKEDVIAEYPCYLLKSILLSGHMFITEKHVSFFAYIPRKTHTTFKSGTLARKARTTGRYSRFWCVIKDNVFSYFNSASDVYFPVGTIDLRYAISVELTDPNLTLAHAGTDPVAFVLTTQTKKYQFRADSYIGAQEWVKALRRAIFRSHNDGDSVKIVLPSENILDIEESPVLECANTIKIKVVDVDQGDTYAIDDYFFSFFSNGSQAFKDLREAVKFNTLSDLPSPAERDEVASETDADEDISQSVLFDMKSPREAIRDTTESRIKAQAPVRHSAPFLASLDLHMSGSKRGSSRSRSNYRSSRSVTPTGIRRTKTPELPIDDYETKSDGHSTPPLSPLKARGRRLSGVAENSLLRAASPLRAITQFHGKVKDFITPSSPSAVASAPSLPSRAHLSPDGTLTDTSEELVEVGSGASSPSQSQFLAHQTPGPHEGWSDWVRKGGRKVQSLLPNVPSGYVEKVTEMWVGSSKHFDGRTMPEEHEREPEEVAADVEKESSERFRAHFALPDDEKLVASFYGYLHRVIPLYGKIYLGKVHLCFRSLLPGTKTKMVLPHEDIENVDKERGFRFGYSGLVVVVHGHEEIFFEFRSSDMRDDCTVTLLRQLDHFRNSPHLASSPGLRPEESALIKSRRPVHVVPRMVRSQDIFESTVVIFDSSQSSVLTYKPAEKLKFTCLTIGSRGDVQPYIALARGLMADGHTVRIATHAEFKDWIESFGIEFRQVAGDPAELMRLSVEHGMFTYGFLKEAASKFRGWITELLETSWIACQDTDVLIESPSAMAGIHVAEALQIPYFRAFTMPWTRTRAYPHAFAVPEQKMGGSYNYISYVMFENVFWKGISGQVNKWRTTRLHLPRTNLDKMQPQKVPFLYNFSPTVVPPPLDYSDWIKVTGYWFLNESKLNKDFLPNAELVEFIQMARRDSKKLVYIGFGSIVVADPKQLTQAVLDSVLQADVRCILSKGWSDRLGSSDADKVEIPLPDSVFQIKSAPHDWLFPQLDAAVHHGGAGTTGASLRAGIPTVIKPFFGDQFFYANRVEDLGAGLHLKKLTVRHFAKVLWEATHNERIISKARLIGKHIQKEDGVGVAVKTIYRDLDYAKSVIMHNSSKKGELDEKDESWYIVEKTAVSSVPA
ncbi:hypothetical protein V1504DRAFT_457762 [Lipomyces starkeyi]